MAGRSGTPRVEAAPAKGEVVVGAGAHLTTPDILIGTPTLSLNITGRKRRPAGCDDDEEAA